MPSKIRIDVDASPLMKETKRSLAEIVYLLMEANLQLGGAPLNGIRKSIQASVQNVISHRKNLQLKTTFYGTNLVFTKPPPKKPKLRVRHATRHKSRRKAS
jgi:hypothetical protein